MTVKELKKELETMPDEAECFFTLWTENGRRNYWFNKTGGKKVYGGVNGTPFAMIAYTDDCPAQRLFNSYGDKLSYLGEKVR